MSPKNHIDAAREIIRALPIDEPDLCNGDLKSIEKIRLSRYCVTLFDIPKDRDPRSTRKYVIEFLQVPTPGAYAGGAEIRLGSRSLSLALSMIVRLRQCCPFSQEWTLSHLDAPD